MFAVIIFYICLDFQMTMYYQTLREYELSLTVDDTVVGMDVAVTLVGVEFPPDGVSEVTQ